MARASTKQPSNPGGQAGLPSGPPPSAFNVRGFRLAIDDLLAEIVALYLADVIPWILGYSGGKDSSATLQLVWLALRQIPAEKRHKPVHVISTDTLVENPIVVRWASASLEAMRVAAAAEGLPIQVHQLAPAVSDSFWVLLIGKGYPAPRHLFRWCTDRLKIRPSNKFIRDTVAANGEAILLLGTRKAESTGRAARMVKLEAERVRDRLSPNASLPGSLVYSPIETWANDDVWTFLLQIKNPWGWSNKELMNLYAGASEGGECPIVVDTSTPSCGSSRFGCWVCTLVEQDKSMGAMIQNDAQKEWMFPLLDLRNALDYRLNEDGDRHLRDFRRMNGKVQLMVTGQGPRVIPGPYTQAARADWLRRLLAAEQWIRVNGPEEVRDTELITMAELHEIRRIWVQEKHELEDLLPGIYQETRGKPFPGEALGIPGIDPADFKLLREVCGDDEHLYALSRDLLAVESKGRRVARRAGLFDSLEKVVRRYTYASEEEAVSAQRGTLKGQIDLFSGSERDLPGESAEAKRVRVAANLERLAAGGGVIGDLAKRTAVDLMAAAGDAAVEDGEEA